MKSILLILMTYAWSANDVALKDIEKKIENGKTVISYTFDRAIDSRKVNLDFINETVQLDLPKAYLEEKKRFTNVEDEKIKNLYSYQLNNDTLRLRVIYSDLDTDSLQEKVNIHFKGNKMLVAIDDGRIPLKEVASKPKERRIETPTIQVEDLVVKENTSQELEKNERSVSKSLEVRQEAIDEKISGSQYDEAAIPVFAGATKKEEKSESSHLNNMVLGITLILGLMLAGFLILKKWSKIKLKNPHTHIKVLTQHHLGPKKTLAIVSVAGESILLGVTDHNISLIKELSLLDDEIPDQVPEKFDATYDQAEEKLQDKEEGVEEDSFNVLGIQDVVKTKLKGMRDL